MNAGECVQRSFRFASFCFVAVCVQAHYYHPFVSVMTTNYSPSCDVEVVVVVVVEVVAVQQAPLHSSCAWPWDDHTRCIYRHGRQRENTHCPWRHHTLHLYDACYMAANNKGREGEE